VCVGLTIDGGGDAGRRMVERLLARGGAGPAGGAAKRQGATA
jgi:hypothetical protein